jgi:hypothetical protein
MTAFGAVQVITLYGETTIFAIKEAPMEIGAVYQN